MTATIESLFAGMDQSFVEFFEEVKALAWGEKPDYEKMIEMFRRAWKRRGFEGEPEDIDWLKFWEKFQECEHLKKAQYADDGKDLTSAVKCQTGPAESKNTGESNELTGITDKQDESSPPVHGTNDPSLVYAMDTTFDY